jgi:hypothetical protein
MKDYEVRINGEKAVTRQLRIAAQQAFERGYKWRNRVEWGKLAVLMVICDAAVIGSFIMLSNWK